MRALILLALLGTAFAVPKSVNRIVGGEETTVEQYPYMANMQFNLFNIWWMQYCGGSLITSTRVLSAAHCFEGDSANQWRVELGTSRASGGGVGSSVHQVQRLVLHETYNTPIMDNDIALVYLITPAVYSNQIQSASIPSTNYNLAVGSSITAIGWGSLSSGGSYPEQLRHVELDVIDQDICTERYAYLKTLPGFSGYPDITPGMLCAGILDVGGKDACQGDSGGPMAYLGNVIVGVTSWGYGCGHETYPGVTARVSHYSDWIVANA